MKLDTEKETLYFNNSDTFRFNLAVQSDLKKLQNDILLDRKIILTLCIINIVLLTLVLRWLL